MRRTGAHFHYLTDEPALILVAPVMSGRQRQSCPMSRPNRNVPIGEAVEMSPCSSRVNCRRRGCGNVGIAAAICKDAGKAGKPWQGPSCVLAGATGFSSLPCVLSFPQPAPMTKARRGRRGPRRPARPRKLRLRILGIAGNAGRRLHRPPSSANDPAEAHDVVSRHTTKCVPLYLSGSASSFFSGVSRSAVSQPLSILVPGSFACSTSIPLSVTLVCQT